MSKAFKAASSLGAVALVLSGAAMAAAPFAGGNNGFDQWSVSSGTVSITDLDTVTAGVQDCPATWTCSPAVTGDGFYQRQVDDGAGNSYFQTIITDKGVSGGPGGLSFSDESFVKTGNTGGLADKSSISDQSISGSLTETFNTSTELNTGWAAPVGGDEVKIYQGIVADEASAEDFRTDFWLAQLGASGANGKLMRITSRVDIELATGAVQDFVLVDKNGTDYVADGSVTAGGDTVNWTGATDNIKAIWVGQDMANVVGVNQQFGYTSYENISGNSTSGFQFADEFSLTSSAATNWNTADPAAGWGSLATDGTGGPF